MTDESIRDAIDRKHDALERDLGPLLEERIREVVLELPSRPGAREGYGALLWAVVAAVAVLVWLAWALFRVAEGAA